MTLGVGGTTRHVNHHQQPAHRRQPGLCDPVRLRQRHLDRPGSGILHRFRRTPADQGERHRPSVNTNHGNAARLIGFAAHLTSRPLTQRGRPFLRTQYGEAIAQTMGVVRSFIFGRDIILRKAITLWYAARVFTGQFHAEALPS